MRITHRTCQKMGCICLSVFRVASTFSLQPHIVSNRITRVVGEAEPLLHASCTPYTPLPRLIYTPADMLQVRLLRSGLPINVPNPRTAHDIADSLLPFELPRLSSDAPFAVQLTTLKVSAPTRHQPTLPLGALTNCNLTV